MATYLYETIDPEQPVEQFEIQQSMKDAPLTHHPVTGVPVRRVISGGFGLLNRASNSGPTPSAAIPGPGTGRACGTGCGCH